MILRIRKSDSVFFIFLSMSIFDFHLKGHVCYWASLYPAWENFKIDCIKMSQNMKHVFIVMDTKGKEIRCNEEQKKSNNIESSSVFYLGRWITC